MKKFIIFLTMSSMLLVSCGGESAQAIQDYELGMRLIKGIEVAQDQKKGIEILTRAADEGSSSAQLALGFFYMKGEGVPKNPTKGLALFEQAAKNGNADAQYNAGLVYVRGEAGSPDLSKAFHWFEAAALQGDPGAQFNVGLMRLKGEGVAADPLIAYAWFSLADRAGYKGARQGMNAAKGQLPENEAGKMLEAVSALEKKVSKLPADQGSSASSEAPAANGVQEITVPL